MSFRWTVLPTQPLIAERIAAELKVSPLLAQCLVNRGVSEPAQVSFFLQPRLKHLADPFLLPSMSVAVERLFLARSRNESVVIFGDYDVDGVTATALLLEIFHRLKCAAQAYLPHRMDEGYGLTREAVENCLRKFPATVLLAVDCGSTAAETIAWLQQEKGIDVIVLAHHQISSPPPKALALINPQLDA